MSTNIAVNNSATNSSDGSGAFGGAVGQAPVPSQAVTDSSTMPVVDPDWLALILVVSAGAGLFIAFAMVRIVRWISLRKPVSTKTDEIGNNVLHRSTTMKTLGWPGMMMGKLALISFRPMGVPSVGMIMIISSWIGFSLFATLFNVQLDLEGIAYRLP
jgi:hypothetical protein